MLEKQNTIGQEVDMGATKGNEEAWMRKKKLLGKGWGLEKVLQSCSKWSFFLVVHTIK
jgi:hypothetical protein